MFKQKMFRYAVAKNTTKPSIAFCALHVVSCFRNRSLDQEFHPSTKHYPGSPRMVLAKKWLKNYQTLRHGCALTFDMCYLHQHQHQQDEYVYWLKCSKSKKKLLTDHLWQCTMASSAPVRARNCFFFSNPKLYQMGYRATCANLKI